MQFNHPLLHQDVSQLIWKVEILQDNPEQVRDSSECFVQGVKACQMAALHYNTIVLSDGSAPPYLTITLSPLFTALHCWRLIQSMMENPIRRLGKGTFDVTHAVCAENQYLNGIPYDCAEATHNSSLTIHLNINSEIWRNENATITFDCMQYMELRYM